jgi:hypothetical protein
MHDELMVRCFGNDIDGLMTMLIMFMLSLVLCELIQCLFVIGFFLSSHAYYFG